ncbi:MAG: hypothetical protein EZS28_016533 [Streblomastix strix]|uniref:Uncharacterized protein n=1 Tax=Streblomastix strix TaxID=222440 RepID=A0A5J4VZG3_9EUKA|nr:MAG: hypothetical protein EZS28_016533 [Streblomastix strix]
MQPTALSKPLQSVSSLKSLQTVVSFPSSNISTMAKPIQIQPVSSPKLIQTVASPTILEISSIRQTIFQDILNINDDHISNVHQLNETTQQQDPQHEQIQQLTSKDGENNEAVVIDLQVSPHPYKPDKRIIIKGRKFCGQFNCLIFQYYNEKTKQIQDAHHKHVLCMECEGSLCCRRERRYKQNELFIHTCPVLNFSQMQGMFIREQQNYDLQINQTLLKAICSAIAETRMSFLSAQSKSIRNLLIETMLLARVKEFLDMSVEDLLPWFDRRKLSKEIKEEMCKLMAD